MVKHLPEVQQRALDLLEKREARTLTSAVQQVEYQMVQEENASAGDDYAHCRWMKPPPSTWRRWPPCKRWWLQAVSTPSSPIRPKRRRFLPTFSDLAAFAAHALKPEGVLVMGAAGCSCPLS